MKATSLFVLFLLTLSLNAQKLDSLYQEARREIGRFQFEKALQLLSTCYIEEPKHIPYLQQIGYCHFQLGRFSDATIFYQQAYQLDSSNTTSLSYLGAIAEKQLDLQRAKGYFSRLIDLDTTNSYYYKRYAQLSYRLRQPLAALENYLQAYRLNKADAEVVEALANLYIRFKQLPFAEKILKDGISIAPRNLQLRYVWARLNNLEKDYPEVIRTLNYCMELGDTTNYFQMMLGAAYVLEDSLESGIWHLEQVVSREKASEAALHYLGLAYRQKGEPEKSREYLLKAIDKGTSDRLGTYYDDLAAIEEEQGNLRESINYMREAWEYDQQPEQLFRLARMADRYYKDKSIAMRYFEQYLQTGDQRFEAYSAARLSDLKEWQHMQNGN